MKRIYLIFILVLAISSSIHAQLKFGAKAGVTSTSINADQTIENISGENYDALEIQGKEATINGFQAGFFGRVSLASLYIQPEVLFSTSTTEVQIKEIDQGTVVDEVTEEQQFNKIDVPLMAGWKFGPARIQFGPVASIVLSNESAIEAATNYEEEFNKATWGYQVGAGLDLFSTLTLDIKYEGSLSKFGDGIVVGNTKREFDSRPNQFIFSLGIFF
jgi:hypothetical protein